MMQAKCINIYTETVNHGSSLYGYFVFKVTVAVTGSRKPQVQLNPYRQLTVGFYKVSSSR